MKIFDIVERSLTKDEEKERLVKGMKKNKSDFKDRYGDDAESVMYATATKRAKDVEEAYTQGPAPSAQLKGKEKAPKTKAGRTEHPHGGRLVGETTSAGAVAAVATPIGAIRKRNQDEVDETTSASGVSVGAPKGKPRNNTGKNALDSKDKLLGEKSRKARHTKR